MTPASYLWFFLSLVLPVLFGYAITTYLIGSSLPRYFTWILAPGIGLGFCSMIFFVFRRPMMTVEFILAIGACFYLYRSRAQRSSLPSKRLSAVSLVFAAALGLAAGASALRVERGPHGDWDGWAIWNTHARFLFRDGSNWRKDIQYSYHSDYPLLSPATAARIWRFTGLEIPEAGALLGAVLGLSASALIAAAVSHSRGSILGMPLAAVLLGTPYYLGLATSQYADVPIAFFILATITLICLSDELQSDKGALALAGFSAGCAAWTKNEGLLFVVASIAALTLPVFRIRLKVIPRLLAFGAGLAVPLATVALFKLTIFGQNDIIEYQHDTMAKILNMSRHTLISQSFVSEFLSFGRWSLSPFILLLGMIVFAGIDRGILRRTGFLTAATIVAFVIVGYYFVYLVTPLDLQYHLTSSLNRLMIQMWPSVLVLMGFVCKSVERDGISNKSPEAPI